MFKRPKKQELRIVTRSADGSISIRNAPSCPKRGVRNSKVPTPELKSKFVIKHDLREGFVGIDLPMRIVSEANCFEHWRLKDKRHKAQRHEIALHLKPLVKLIKLPCNIKLIRFAPNKLDKHDNLPMSFKYITDAICAIITGNYIHGQADSDDRISISYGQKQTKYYGIKIEITF